MVRASTRHSVRAFNALARSEPARRRQKRPLLRQQFLKRRVEPHGHKSLSPRRSRSSTSPSRIVRAPRFTRVSDGKPLRRLLIGSKGERLLWICLLSWHGCLLALMVWTLDSAGVEGLQTGCARDKRTGSGPKLRQKKF